MRRCQLRPIGGCQAARVRIGRATENLSRTRYTDTPGLTSHRGPLSTGRTLGVGSLSGRPITTRGGERSERRRHRTSRDASTRVCRRGARDRGRASAPPGRARDPSWANPIFRPSADRARSGRHGVSPTRSRGAGRREVQAIAEVAHDTSPLATHPIVPFRLRPSWRGWRPDRKASSPFWLVPCDAYVGFGSSST